ncbi:MAG TPA: hypothetical protein VFQ99_02360 [Gallionella sp.]|nr:hypothetical protein [Gallionella sp.]
MKTDFSPGDRTYYVSDERLRAFRQLTPEQKLRWVEELAMFLRMARVSREKPQEIPK